MKTHMHKWIKWIVIAACVAALTFCTYVTLFRAERKQRPITEKRDIKPKKTQYVRGDVTVDYYDAENDRFVIIGVPEQENNIKAPSDMPKTVEEQRVLDRNLLILAEVTNDKRANAINDRIFAYYRKGNITSLEVTGAEDKEAGRLFEVNMADGSGYVFEVSLSTVTSIKEKSVADGDYANYIYTLYRPLPQYD